MKLDLTPLDKPGLELASIFKHLITREVACESVPYATRAKFHQAIGAYIKRRCGDSPGPQVDLLAFHLDRSNNAANSACAMLNDTERSTLLNEGSRMVLEQAVDYALKAVSE